MPRAKLRILVVAMLALAIIPLVEAQLGNVLQNAFQKFFELMSNIMVVFGLTFIFLLILFYAIFAAALGYVTVFGSGGKTNKYGRMVAISFAFISDTGIMFVIAGSPPGSVERVLQTMGTFAVIALSLLVFALTYLNLKGDKKTWPVTFLGVGVGMLTYGLLSNTESWFAWGWLFIIIGIIWFILSENYSAPSDGSVPSDQLGGVASSSPGGGSKEESETSEENETEVEKDLEKQKIGSIRGRVINAIGTLQTGRVPLNEKAVNLANPNNKGVRTFKGDGLVRVKRLGQEKEIADPVTINPDGTFIFENLPLHKDIITFVKNPMDPSKDWTHKTKPFGRPLKRDLNLIKNRNEENVIVCARPPDVGMTDVDLPEPPPPLDGPERDGTPSIHEIEKEIPLTDDEKRIIRDAPGYHPKAEDPAGAYTTVSLQPWFLNIEDQKDIGACASFASGSLREFHQNYEHRNRYPQLRLSKLYLYWKVRPATGKDEQSGGIIKEGKMKGSTLISNAEQLKNGGCCLWGKYVADKDFEKYDLPPGTAAEENAPHQKIEGYEKIPAKSEGDIKIWVRALLSGHPIFFCMNVGKKFMLYQAKDMDEVFNEEGDSKEGYHAMVIVGYNSHKEFSETEFGPAFLIRNSWGVNWGYNGYAWVKATYILERRPTQEPFYVFTKTAEGKPALSGPAPQRVENKVIELISQLKELQLKPGENLGWHDEKGEKLETIEKIVDVLHQLEYYDKYLEEKKIDEDRMIESLSKFLKDVETKFIKKHPVKELMHISDDKINQYLKDIEDMFLNSKKIAAYRVDGKIKF